MDETTAARIEIQPGRRGRRASRRAETRGGVIVEYTDYRKGFGRLPNIPRDSPSTGAIQACRTIVAPCEWEMAQDRNRAEICTIAFVKKLEKNTKQREIEGGLRRNDLRNAFQNLSAKRVGPSQHLASRGSCQERFLMISARSPLPVSRCQSTGLSLLLAQRAAARPFCS